MKKRILYGLFLLITGMASMAQTGNKITASGDIYTSLQPADKRPAVFSSQQDLDAKIQDKKNNVLAAIRENSGDSVKVKWLREKLWRFENAVVHTPKAQ